MARATAARRRVLLLLPNLAGGGAERLAMNLARHLDPALHEVRIGLLEASGEYLPQIEPGRLLVAPRPRPRWLARQPFESPLRGLASAWQIRRLVETFRPEIVVSFMLDTSVPAGLALRTATHRPRCWFVHEGNHTSVVVRQAIPNPLLRALLQRLIRATYAACDGLIATSAGVRSDLLAAFAVPAPAVSVIGNPTDLDAIRLAAAQPPAFDPGAPYLVAVGRLVRQKGFDVLLRAFAGLPDPALRLVILGEGAERARLQRLAGELGVADRVDLPGFVANPWAIMRRARVFCLSSRMEGFGNVVPEALALGLPVVVTDCDFGPREIVRDGVDGCVVPHDDPSALRAALARLLADAVLAQACAASGRQRARDYGAVAIADAYARLFDGVSGCVSDGVPNGFSDGASEGLPGAVSGRAADAADRAGGR